MKKIDMFNVSAEYKESQYYSIDNYDTDPMAIIKFRDLPTENTRILLIAIMDKYNPETSCSILNLDIMDNFTNIFREFDILKGISFQTYTAFQDKNYNSHELFVEYPLVLGVGKYINRIEIKIHHRFKEFCDKFDFTYREEQ